MVYVRSHIQINPPVTNPIKASGMILALGSLLVLQEAPRSNRGGALSFVLTTL